jgi:hypothetical protein
VKKIFTTTAAATLLILLFGGWGGTGHIIINKNIYVCLPTSMNFPKYWSDTLTAHASDPDSRKSADKTESPRHFIDIDAYPEFVTNGFISQKYDSVVLQHTSSWVIKQGTVPWAIVTWEDSLKRAFQQKNWHMAMQLASDLGHYVGDAHQPLHITQNYDGGMSNQRGVHSRYESDLIGQYWSNILYTNDSASYVPNVSDYTFNFLYSDYQFLDSVLYGDSVATAVAGSNSGAAYLAKYWELAGSYTTKLMKLSSKATADLIYTAWVDAGSPSQNPNSVNGNNISSLSFNLNQNYPNPFNPTTSIRFSIGSKGNVTLKVYNVLGKEAAVLVNGEKEAGNYEANFNASGLPSGVYFYELNSAGNMLTKKMIIMK